MNFIKRILAKIKSFRRKLWINASDLNKEDWPLITDIEQHYEALLHFHIDQLKKSISSIKIRKTKKNDKIELRLKILENVNKKELEKINKEFNEEIKKIRELIGDRDKAIIKYTDKIKNDLSDKDWEIEQGFRQLKKFLPNKKLRQVFEKAIERAENLDDSITALQKYQDKIVEQGEDYLKRLLDIKDNRLDELEAHGGRIKSSMNTHATGLIAQMRGILKSKGLEE